MSHLRFSGLALAVPLLLAACGGDSSFDLKLVVRDCDAQESLLPARGILTLTVTGDGMKPVSVSADSNAGSLAIPEIPAGKNRVVNVEVRDRDGGRPSNGEDGEDRERLGALKAVGRSLPFEVKDSGMQPVRVVLYRVNGFTRTRTDEQSCTDLSGARAGHTATLLKDGKVLIAGGFSTYEGRQPGGFLGTAELFDPASGTFEKLPDICEGARCLKLAFSSGVLLQDGRVLLVGGQEEVDGSIVTTASAAIFDPTTKRWDLSPSMETARRGHSASFFKHGEVVVIGGVDQEGNVVEELEAFDPATGSFSTVVKGDGEALSLPRAYHVAVPYGGDRGVYIVAGGIDETGALPQATELFRWEQSKEAYEIVQKTNNPVVLGEGTMGAGAAFVDGSTPRITLVGGATRWMAEGAPGIGTASNTSKVVQWFDAFGGQGRKGEAELSRERLNPCVVQLGKQRAITLGGFGESGGALDTAEVLSFQTETDQLVADLTERQGKMRSGRGYATCTDLGEGRVLMIGGVNAQNAVVPSAEIYIAP